MKNLKKLLSLLLVMILVLSIAACSKEVEPEETSMDLTKEEPKEEVKEEATEEMVEEVSVESLAKDYFTNIPEHIYKIGQVDFIDKVIAGDDMFILDIRSADDYGKGHVAGAVNAPWGTAISDSLNKIPQDQEVFIYCYSGQTAGQAVATLNVAGINARSVNLGWNFGISKVEGVDAVTETTANEFGSDTYEVNAQVQTVLDSYYAGLAEVKETTYGNYKISEANLKAMIDNDDDFYLLSARGAEDFGKAHIEGANNVPFNASFVDNLAGVPKDKKVVVYCYSGQTAGQATAIMKLLGYDVVSLNGGMGVGSNAPLGWTNKGYTVVSSSTLYNGIVGYFANMPEHIYKIGQADFADKVIAGDDMVIVDIRKAADYEKGHAIGAINLPWGPAIAEGLTSISQDKEVFIYCYSGQTAGQAVMTLNLAGINARSVNLGWNFGISKLENITDITETTVNEFGADTFEVDAEIADAITVYYAGLAAAGETQYGNYKVSEETLNTMIEMEEEFFLLSARQAKDYDIGHIKGAVNVPFGADMLNGLGGVPMDSKVVVYCYSGQTAGQATAAMRLLGYDAVSLNGGAGVGANAPLGWTNQGFELVAD